MRVKLEPETEFIGKKIWVDFFWNNIWFKYFFLYMVFLFSNLI